MASIKRIGTPRWANPQPDRDFSQGQRPTDTLNRALPQNPGNQGNVLGGAGMFKPRQGSFKKPQQQQQRATVPKVSMTIQGSSPQDLAQALQGVVNQTGPTAMRGTTGSQAGGNDNTYPPEFVAWLQQFQQSFPGGPVTPLDANQIAALFQEWQGQTQQPGTEQPPVEQPPNETPVNPPGTPPPGPATNLPTSMATLQDYLNAVNQVDLIDESAYGAFGGWTPQLPEMVQQKAMLDSALHQQLSQAFGNQETAKAMTALIVQRLIEDEVEQIEDMREQMAGRGILESSITGDNRGRIQKANVRSASGEFANLVNDLLGTSGGLSTGYGDYINSVVGLASDEAGILAQRPGEIPDEGGTDNGTGNGGGSGGGNDDGKGYYNKSVKELRGEIKRIRNKKGPLTEWEKKRIQNIRERLAVLLGHEGQLTGDTIPGGSYG